MCTDSDPYDYNLVIRSANDGGGAVTQAGC